MKNYRLLLLTLLICCYSSCRIEQSVSEEIEYALSTTNNEFAIRLLNQISLQQDVYLTSKDYSIGYEILYNNTVLSSLPNHGHYYTVPYAQNNIVEGCVLFPFSGTASSFTLHDPINLNIKNITSITGSNRYFASMQFLEFKEFGLKVNPQLYTDALELEKEDVIAKDVEILGRAITRYSSDAETTAKINLEYKCTSTAYPDQDGIEVTALNINTVINCLQDI